MMPVMFRRTLLAALALVSAPLTLHARVVRVAIDTRTVIAGSQPFGAAGPYERITGRIYFAFDPRNPQNARITDLQLAPRNADGETEAWSEFVLLLPRDPAKRNGVTLVDVVNRGGMTVGVFQPGSVRGASPDSAAAYGDGFLLRRGYAIMMIGWQWDILPGTTGLHFAPPVARDGPRAITGLVRSDITIDSATRTIPLGHRVATSQALGYAVADATDPANTLTVRDAPAAPRTVLARGTWRFTDARTVSLAGGFVAGKIYEVIYRAKDPVVAGTGLAAVRDVISYLKYSRGSIAPTRFGIAYGVSQTGRFLRHFLYDGFNTDERGRKAFDGIFAHTAGAGRGSFNHRFAQPSRDAQPYSTFFYPTDLFPFTSPDERDPLTGAQGGLRTAVPPGTNPPRVFYVDGGYEYWGRAASLTHTTVDGVADVGFLPSERRYVISGAQHSSPAAWPPVPTVRIDSEPAYRGNPLDQRLALRALLVALTEWVTTNTAPPPSAYPSLGAATLVDAATRVMPALPGVPIARTPYTPVRLDLGASWPQRIIDREPPALGAPYVVLVPRSDSLGNDVGAVQSVELRVPLATYLPWQLRRVPPTDRLASFVGSFVPLAKTAAGRRHGDLRPSVEELYPSRDAFLRAVDDASATLSAQRFLLPEDRALAHARMAAVWDWVQAQ